MSIIELSGEIEDSSIEIIIGLKESTLSNTVTDRRT